MKSNIKFLLLSALAIATQTFPMQEAMSLPALARGACAQMSGLVQRAKVAVINSSSRAKIAAGCVAVGGAAAVYAVVQLRKKAEYEQLIAGFTELLQSKGYDCHQSPFFGLEPNGEKHELNEPVEDRDEKLRRIRSANAQLANINKNANNRHRTSAQNKFVKDMLNLLAVEAEYTVNEALFINCLRGFIFQHAFKYPSE